MSHRIDCKQASSGAIKAMQDMETCVRVSQINGWNRLPIDFRAPVGS